MPVKFHDGERVQWTTNVTAPRNLIPFRLLIQDIRKRQGLSRKKVAQMASMSPMTLDYIEHGQIRPTVDHLIRIAHALGTKFWWDLVEVDWPERVETSEEPARVN